MSHVLGPEDRNHGRARRGCLADVEAAAAVMGGSQDPRPPAGRGK
jgi:hypothetical protein